jgi:stromal membrane-associated protein
VQQKAPEPENDLFSLDFHAPASSTINNSGMVQQPKKDVKNDILSLYSTPAQGNSALVGQAFGQPSTSPPVFQPSSSHWGAFNSGSAQPTQVQPQATNMMGTNGVGAWGTSSGWNSPTPAPPAQANLWEAPATVPVQQQQPDLFGGNVWGASGGGGLGNGGLGNSGMGSGGMDLWASSANGTGIGQGQKKDDAFGDIWGGFK